MAFIRYLQSLKLPSFLTQLPRFQKKPPVGLYNLHVVSLEEELEFLYLLPKEFRYALQKDPSLKNRIAKILKNPRACFERHQQHCGTEPAPNHYHMAAAVAVITDTAIAHSVRP